MRDFRRSASKPSPFPLPARYNTLRSPLPPSPRPGPAPGPGSGVGRVGCCRGPAAGSRRPTIALQARSFTRSTLPTAQAEAGDAHSSRREAFGGRSTQLEPEGSPFNSTAAWEPPPPVRVVRGRVASYLRRGPGRPGHWHAGRWCKACKNGSPSSSSWSIPVLTRLFDTGRR